MTTKVSTLHDAMVTLIAAALPSAQRIANPYELGEAPGLFLDNGYGIAFGPTENGKRNLSCSLAMTRSMAVMLTRLVATTDNAAALAGDIEKAMFEDQLTLIRAFNQSPTLNASVDDIQYVADSGIEFVTQAEDGSGRYYALTSVFRVQYSEDIT